ncbi:hypothetical protein H0H92_006015 [Tricholoma furcatifolium]|nr:hypothetical protein H0H92_006015 [Tricholoma furcatifolium]
MVLGIAGLIPNHPRVFFPLTREGNYTQVRMAAFDGLFLTKWYTPSIMCYVLAIMGNDDSRIIRRHVAHTACHSLVLLAQMGEMKTSLKETESLLIEEDGTLLEKAKELKKSELDAMIKVLRKDPPDVDQEVCWCLLKLADLLIRPIEETAPTVKIHIPSTPVVDVAPPLSAAKAPIKAVRAIKSGGPAPKSPLAPINIPTKLKLHASPALEVIPPTPATPCIDSPRKSSVSAVPSSSTIPKKLICISAATR